MLHSLGTRSAVDLKRYSDISQVYRSWLHSLGTRSAVDLLKVFSTSFHPILKKLALEAVWRIGNAQTTQRSRNRGPKTASRQCSFSKCGSVFHFYFFGLQSPSKNLGKPSLSSSLKFFDIREHGDCAIRDCRRSGCAAAAGEACSRYLYLGVPVAHVFVAIQIQSRLQLPGADW